MAKKCEKCGAPIEGFLSKISGFMGVKKSETDPNKCTKCVTGDTHEHLEETKVEHTEAPKVEMNGTEDVADEIQEEKEMEPTEEKSETQENQPQM
ncbi:hypothetical protein COT97_01490 [Candidatus Falkowbacteria bacterium CG10_big_fil_rev_8_21_14_0_10_39_11]|uniref:Uncharacterized protein n=1 Tax=Candidatus Falkowbacteria bacterium CG10_big_fil_rev_8_21_14_0_10_39_11 TaxID=1974565 RepID=A0A2H0V5M3_9BACT|nr:MAG: hypothetical protein COT97_01490 [Candidatus Falkowbacteria bacterium CG10_big_fil_rev_8_21_14_0_10_39_11]